MARNKCIGNKRKREDRKKEREEKKKKGKRTKKSKKENKRRKKKKERGEGWGKQSEIKKKHGGVSSDSVYFKSLDFPWNLAI